MDLSLHLDEFIGGATIIYVIIIAVIEEFVGYVFPFELNWVI